MPASATSSSAGGKKPAGLRATGPVPVSIYLVRHAHAVSRDAWSGSDKLRPLTERGVKEARAIVAIFDAVPVGSPDVKPAPGRGHKERRPRPTSLLSSGAERCLATLRPLAEACELPIVIADYLSEGSDPAEVLVHVKSLAASGGVPVLCSHGDVILGIVDLLKQARTPLSGSAEIKKGSVLILEAAAGSVESARYLPPAKV
jgi:8-oxo-dGTP diphosphatase